MSGRSFAQDRVRLATVREDYALQSAGFLGPWRDLPEPFGTYSICYSRFVRWRRTGVRCQIMSALVATHDCRGLDDPPLHRARAPTRRILRICNYGYRG